jgi:hypothetical protein
MSECDPFHHLYRVFNGVLFAHARVLESLIGAEWVNLQVFAILNRTRQHWGTRRYGAGSGSDRAPIESPSQQGARSLPLPAPYQCRLLRFSPKWPNYIISFATYGQQRIAQIVIVDKTQISIFHLHRRTSNRRIRRGVYS